MDKEAVSRAAFEQGELGLGHRDHGVGSHAAFDQLRQEFGGGGVDRGRVDRLEEGLDRRLTLVSAPAGFGKSTLLAQWLQRRVEPSQSGSGVAWLALDTDDRPPGPKVRDLHGVLDDAPTVPEPLLRLARWVADYYIASLGQVLRTALPAALSDASFAGAAAAELLGSYRAAFLVRRHEQPDSGRRRPRDLAPLLSSRGAVRRRRERH